MKVIIAGCGRVGAGVARMLSQNGHAVTVIDSDPDAFERLGAAFKGQKLVGVGFDRDVLLQAGIERADGFAAVTNSDEANIVALRIAKQVFRVPRVAGRVYDPRKAEIYRRLGLQTISPVAIGSHRLVEMLSFLELHVTANLGSGEVDIVDAEVPRMLVGRMVKELTVVGEFQVTAITRIGKTFLPTTTTVFEDGDLLHIAVQNSSFGRLKSLLGLL